MGAGREPVGCRSSAGYKVQFSSWHVVKLSNGNPTWLYILHRFRANSNNYPFEITGKNAVMIRKIKVEHGITLLSLKNFCEDRYTYQVPINENFIQCDYVARL